MLPSAFMRPSSPFAFVVALVVVSACGNAQRTSAEVAGVTGVTAIAIGSGQTCFLVEDGQVRCLGTNADGELGNGETASSKTKTPRTVIDAARAPLRGVQRLRAFRATTCARRGSDVWSCWGKDPLGVLDQPERTVAAVIPFLNGATAMTMGSGDRVLGYYDPGTTISPGDSIRFAYVCGTFAAVVRCRTARQSQLDASPTFATLDLYAGRAQIVASGTGAFCVLSEAREASCSPLDVMATSGGSAPIADCEVDANGVKTTCAETEEETRNRVLEVDASLVLKSIDGQTSSSLDVGAEHACLRNGDGTVDCLGLTFSGEAGKRAAGTQRIGRTRVSGVFGVVELALGDAFSCARSDNGEVHCWGNNSAGQLGSDVGIQSEIPRQVTLSGPAKALAAGTQHACAAVGVSGQLVCWGSSYTTPF